MSITYLSNNSYFKKYFIFNNFNLYVMKFEMVHRDTTHHSKTQNQLLLYHHLDNLNRINNLKKVG